MLWDKLYGSQPDVAAFIAGLDPGLIRVRGTAVYMTGKPEVVPTPLVHNIKVTSPKKALRSKIPSSPRQD